jgi:quercetin dioxygenase-like cupin family protein
MHKRKRGTMLRKAELSNVVGSFPSPAPRSWTGWRKTIGATTVELTADDIREIDDAASQITAPGARYREHQEHMTGRWKAIENDMQITRNSTETAAGPSEWFTGTVYIDPVAAPAAGSRLSASSVHFTPGARTAWHIHPNGQTIYVTEGVGLCQRRGGAIEVIRPGDRVFFEPGEDHWHGAAPDRFMTHLAMLEVDDDGNPATWGDHVTDEEYNATPAG